MCVQWCVAGQKIRENLSDTNLWQAKVHIFHLLSIYDNAILIPTYWTPRFCYKTQISELPETFTAAKACWSTWWAITNNCSAKCGRHWVWVWRSFEGRIQTNWNGFLRYFLQSFVQVKILDIAVYGAECTCIFNRMVCFFVCDMHCWACFTGFRFCLSPPFLSTFRLFLTNIWWQVYISFLLVYIISFLSSKFASQLKLMQSVVGLSC